MLVIAHKGTIPGGKKKTRLCSALNSLRLLEEQNMLQREMNLKFSCMLLTEHFSQIDTYNFFDLTNKSEHFHFAEIKNGTYDIP